MRRSVQLSVVAGFALLACSGGGGFTGKWDSTFGAITLEIKADHTVSFTTMGIPNEGTWEPRDKNSIVIHGPQRDDMVLTRDKEGGLSAGIMGRFVRHKD